MIRSRRFALAPSLAMALLLAACGDGTGPGPTKLADPLATAAKVQALDAIFSSPAFDSFRFARNYFSTGTGPLAALRTLLRAARPALADGPTMSPMERQLSAAAAAFARPAGSATAAVLPPELRGQTFAWNATTFQYEATQRPGAPPNGVRFILYALDPGGAPIVTQEIGYVDLMDESSGATDRLHTRVVGTTSDPPVTYVDYTVSVTATTISGTVTVVGFVTNGTRRLDFNAVVTASETSITVDIRFDVNADDVHARLELTFTEPTPSTLKVTVDSRLQLAAEVVTVTGSETFDFDTFESTGTYTVRVNAGIYATITITDGEPSYAGGGGQELTADDVAALSAIYEATYAMLARLLDLVAPGGPVLAP